MESVSEQTAPRLQPEAVCAHCELFEEITSVVSRGSRHDKAAAEERSPYCSHI